MPRKKASAPQRLNENQRENQNWNLGESSAGNHVEVIDLINDEVENYDSDEDADFVPDETKPKRSTKGRKLLYHLESRTSRTRIFPYECKPDFDAVV